MAGTAVLVMTDVEGSTRLWAAYPDRMDVAMRRHHQIVHAAITAHGGWRPVDQGEGDAVFAAFDSAPAAVAAVAQFQWTLAAEPWPTGIELRVRVGIHAGDVITRDGNLFGSTVNRCARLRALGTGGQVLLSAAVFELVRDALPDGMTVVDLGEHRMKDLTRPEEVHQLVIPGLPTEFPPLASLDRARHNLPVQTSSFLGRTLETRELMDLMSRERLVTIVGFGGMGKTRLALQVAAELATGDGDGVWFVDLSAVTDPGQVPSAVATSLGISEQRDGLLAAVSTRLRFKKLLLVLDNVEQLLPDVTDVIDQIVRAGQGVRVLVTSREPLHLTGEFVFLLGPLPVPPAPRSGIAWTERELVSLSTYDAVLLFLRRAGAVSRGFTLTPNNAAAVAGICARLDGMPLALELAAARTRSLSPEALLPRLEHALTILTGGSRDLPTRQQTLLATIAWSYDTLAPAQQQLLDRLSIFAGAFTLSAAEAICSPALDPHEHDLDVLDGITSLVDRNLLIHHPTARDQPEDRYSLLGSIKEYATDHLLTAGHTETLLDRHAGYFTGLVTLPPDWTREDRERRTALVARELPDLRAALTRTQASGSRISDGRLAEGVAGGLTRLGLLSEARSVLDHALDQLAAGTVDRLDLLLRRVSLEYKSGQVAGSRPWAHQAVSEARALGEVSILAFALSQISPRTRAEARDLVAEGRLLLADVSDTGSHIPRWAIEEAWDNLPDMVYADPEGAEAAARRVLAADAGFGDRAAGLNLGYVLLAQGRLAEAEPLLAPFERPDESSDDASMSIIGVFWAATLRVLLGDLAAAKRDLDLSAGYLRVTEMPAHAADVLILRAVVSRLEGDRSRAESELRQLLTEVVDADSTRTAHIRYLLAVLAREAGDPSAATHLLSQAWSDIVGSDALHVDLILECLLERAVQLVPTAPVEAVRLIGLVAADRRNVALFDGVEYDTDAMLADLRHRLGDDDVQRILDETWRQPLPDH